MSIRTFFVATAAAGGLAIFGAGAAGASAGAEGARETLNAMCEERGGLAVYTPYAIGRCQDARANKGFEAEREFCEGLGDTAFTVTISARHMNRANWACFSTVPVT